MMSTCDIEPDKLYATKLIFDSYCFPGTRKMRFARRQSECHPKIHFFGPVRSLYFFCFQFSTFKCACIRQWRTVFWRFFSTIFVFVNKSHHHYSMLLNYYMSYCDVNGKHTLKNARQTSLVCSLFLFFVSFLSFYWNLSFAAK